MSTGTRVVGAASMPAGVWALIAAELVLAAAGSWCSLGVGVALWGLHMAMTQGLLAAMVADTEQADLRDTAYGSSTC